MPALIVTYELKGRPPEEYAGLYEYLKQSPRWFHLLESTWLVVTHESPNQLFKRLQPHLDPSDRLLVGVIAPPMQGWLPDEAWHWIRQHAYPRARRFGGLPMRRWP